MTKSWNQIKTLGLLVAMSALFLWVGQMVGGQAGMMTAFILSLVMNLGAYWFSDKLVLSMHGAKLLAEEDTWGVHQAVRELAHRAGLPMPRVYLVPGAAPNAFATGRDPEHAAIAVTEGLLERLNPREVRAVLAHELGHVQNRDILISTVVACFASAVMYLGHMMQWAGIIGHRRDAHGDSHGPHPLAYLLTVIVAPMAAMLIQMAISRTREYLADESGANFSADPEALASALIKISGGNQEVSQAETNEDNADLRAAFSPLYISHPFQGGGLWSLFSTHPPVHQRVKRLQAMAKSF